MERTIVVVEFKNTSPQIFEFRALEKLDVEKILTYLIEHEDFNEERDSFTIIDGIIKINYEN